MADQARPFRDLLARIANDAALTNAITAREQRYQQTTGVIAEAMVFEDGDLSYDAIADIFLTGINGRNGLPEQIVRVEYLRNDQKLIIPAGLGMTWTATANNNAFLPTNAEMRSRFWRATQFSLDKLENILNNAGSSAAIREALAERDDTPEAVFPAMWNTNEWLGVPGTRTAGRADVLFTLLSKALQFNFDIRDFGYLLKPHSTMPDNAWFGDAFNAFTVARLDIKLKPYTVQMITALNYPPCSDYPLGAWVRAYGMAVGIYPAKGSASMDESIFTMRMPLAANMEAARVFERSYEDLMIPICCNILSIFGLLHLNKDHTFRTNDESMDRIGTSYLQTLRTSATSAMLEQMSTRKEILLRTAPHPFGLAQTYTLAQIMYKFNLLMPALSIRHNTAPPPVQRIFVTLAACEEWGGFPVGADINATYADHVVALREAAATIRQSPPSYSELRRLYGVTEKPVLDDKAWTAVKALMPIAYGYAMVYHVVDNRKKDGIALALSLANVERDMKGQAVAWKNAWDVFVDRLDKQGIEAFLEGYRAQNQ